MWVVLESGKGRLAISVLMGSDVAVGFNPPLPIQALRSKPKADALQTVNLLLCFFIFPPLRGENEEAALAAFRERHLMKGPSIEETALNPKKFQRQNL